jgi:SOS-response transcriptional repressor LexA
MTAPTPAQERVLRLIDRLARERGMPPTLREIAAGLGVGSASGVRQHVLALVRDGWLHRDPLVSRGLRVLRLPGAAAAPASCPTCGREFAPEGGTER